MYQKIGGKKIGGFLESRLSMFQYKKEKQERMSRVYIKIHK